MASSTPSLSKTSNPPLSSSSRLIPHQPQFMQAEPSHRHRSQHHQNQNKIYEKKLVKIQNTQLIEENLMPINFSSSSSSTNSTNELEMKLQQRSRRKSSRILRGLTTALMSYPVLESKSSINDTLISTSAASVNPNYSNSNSNSNYHLKWDDHFNSTVAAIQCLLANETFVDVTLVCDEDEHSNRTEIHDDKNKNLVNGNYCNTLYSNSRRIGGRSSSNRRLMHRDEEDEDMDAFADDEENEMSNLKTNSSSYQVKLKAHKVILSTCSEYFRKIFSENPCKHPVIVLKDFQQWEVRSLLDFMYKGQVILRPERLETLLKAADALQIQGLRECIEKSDEWIRLQTMQSVMRERTGEGSDNEVESLQAKTRVLNRTSDNTNTSHHRIRSRQSRSQGDNESGPSSPKLLNLSMSGEGMSPHLTPIPTSNSHQSPYDESNGPQTITGQQTGAPTHHNHQTNLSASSPPFPRRKQARPRRRSGDFVAQDLRITVTPPLAIPPTNQEYVNLHDYQIHHNNNKIYDFTLGRAKAAFDRPPHLNHLISSHFLKNWPLSGIGSPIGTLPHPHSSPVKHELDSDDETSSPPDRFRSAPGTPDSASPLYESKQFSGDMALYNDPVPGLSFKTSPPSPSFFLNLNNGHPLMSGHHSDPESNNPESASTPPSVFSPAGFPHNSGNGGNHNSSSHHAQPWPGLPMGPAPIFGRHRAQHSAPRGGPPRAWSNADLTEALHNVWNKKMTTSQASRIFGIPYNSLLMYVRGKYGKSLKLDLLKKGLDLALENSNNANSLNSNGTPGISSTLISNNNNNTPPNQKSKSYSNSEDSPPSSLTLTHSHLVNNSGGGGDPQDIIPSGFNPFSAVSSIFGDYPPPFPFPPGLSHILPPVNHLSTDKVNATAMTRRNDADK